MSHPRFTGTTWATALANTPEEAQQAQEWAGMRGIPETPVPEPRPLEISPFGSVVDAYWDRLVSMHARWMMSDQAWHLPPSTAPTPPPTSRSPKSPGYVPRWAKGKK